MTRSFAWSLLRLRTVRTFPEIGSSAVRAPSVAAAANMPFYAKIAVISTG